MPITSVYNNRKDKQALSINSTPTLHCRNIRGHCMVPTLSTDRNWMYIHTYMSVLCHAICISGSSMNNTEVPNAQAKCSFLGDPLGTRPTEALFYEDNAMASDPAFTRMPDVSVHTYTYVKNIHGFQGNFPFLSVYALDLVYADENAAELFL
ncbi:hypothetical protein TWF718_002955 [Orbilia javanica]|uniref:Uncharacterized protein n=1 Tax=Orbilia javanica TaxID=47235 RepID=A0AAN8R9B0_9PEZI